MKIIERKEPSKLANKELMVGKRHTCIRCGAVIEFESTTDLQWGHNQSLFYWCPSCNGITTIHANEIKESKP